MASEDIDYYKLLELEPTASVEEIQRAYRKRSRTCHPDKVGDDPDAAKLFHELTLSRDTLTDPVKRTSYDDLYRAKLLREARFKEMDAKRQREKEDLERRERDGKRRRPGELSDADKTKLEMERIREETRLRMAAIMKQKAQTAAVASSIAQEVQGWKYIIENASILDCTIKVKWKKSVSLTEEDIKSSFVSYVSVPSSLKVIPSKSGKRNASVVFRSLLEAYAAMKSIKLEGVEFLWAGGSEPDACKAIRSLEAIQQPTTSFPETPASVRDELPRKTEQIPGKTIQEKSNSSFPSATSSFGAYEDLTLKRMRERERLRQEMLSEDNDGA